MKIWTKVCGLFERGKRDAEMAEEMWHHVELQAELNAQAGMSPDEARYAALRQFGNVASIQERAREGRGWMWLEQLLQDGRYAFRGLRKSPAFTSVVVITLMLGIGANVVVFGVLNSIILRPLPVKDPQGLYQIRREQRMSGGLLTTSYPAFEDLRRRNTTFSGMAGVYSYSTATLGWGKETRKVRGCEVTGNYFDLLGVQPLAGRFFREEDEHGQNSAPCVVLSNGLWRSLFASDPSVIGANVRLNQQSFEVIGVAPVEFHGTEHFERPDYWIPLAAGLQARGRNILHDRSIKAVMAIGRLKPDVTARRAVEDLNAIAGQLAQEYPLTDRGISLRLIQPGLFGDDGEVIRGFLWSIAGLMFLLLAAAWTNLANLFAARAEDRRRELALRLALGATRWRLLRQLFTEAMIVSLIGGGAGLAGADLLLRALNRWQPPFGYGGQRLALSVTVDVPVCVAGLVLSLGCALLFGLIPAWQVWKDRPWQATKGGLSYAGRFRRLGVADVLLGTQIALCTLLMMAAQVAVSGMMRTLHTPLGFKPQGVMLAQMELRRDGQESLQSTQKAMIDAIQSIAGVESAGMAHAIPMGGGRHGVPVYREGTTEPTPDKSVLETRIYPVSPGYLETAGSRRREGRDVSWQDTAKTPDVAIVNETFALKIWGRKSAIGNRFLIEGKLVEVIGVAEDGKYHDLMEPSQAAVYVPLMQHAQSEVTFVVRSGLDPLDMATALRRTLGGFEPDAEITLQSWIDALKPVLFPARAAALVLGVMGFLAGLLVATGIFGMAAYSVSKRTKELGIRVALGARRSQVANTAVGRPLLLLGAGSIAGILAGLLADSLLGKIVYQAAPGNPAVMAGVVLTMLMVGIAGAAIPAWRASKVDPMVALRAE